MIYHHNLNLSESRHWYLFHFPDQIIVYWLRSPSSPENKLRNELHFVLPSIPAFPRLLQKQNILYKKNSCMSNMYTLLERSTNHTYYPLHLPYCFLTPAITSSQFSLRMSCSIKLWCYGYNIIKHNLWIRFGTCKMRRLNQLSKTSVAYSTELAFKTNLPN